MDRNQTRPSIFILLAEEQFNTTLRKATKFLLKFVFDKYPNLYFSCLKSKISEIHLFIDIVIQYCFLHRWNSSWTEHFLSLQRFNHSQTPLNHNEIILSLVLLCIVPYLLEKLYHQFETIKDQQLLNEKIGQQIQLNWNDQSLLDYYPKLKQLYSMLKIVLWVSYAAGSHNYGHKLLIVLQNNIQLGYRNEQILSNDKSNFHYRLTETVAKIFDLTMKSSAFLVQFLEYWYSQSDVRQMLANGFVEKCIPSAPKKLDLISTSSDICPLCLQTRINKTAISTSGYVFCYRCIHEYVTQNGKCPVTGFCCTTGQLIRIFE